MKTEMYLICPFDGNQWQKDELVQGKPFRRIRQLLGGGWEKKTGLLDEDRAMAAVRGERRVLVLRLNDDMQPEQAERIVERINAERIREGSN